jgi:hypothetical protein
MFVFIAASHLAEDCRLEVRANFGFRPAANSRARKRRGLLLDTSQGRIIHFLARFGKAVLRRRDNPPAVVRHLWI